MLRDARVVPVVPAPTVVDLVERVDGTDDTSETMLDALVDRLVGAAGAALEEGALDCVGA